MDGYDRIDGGGGRGLDLARKFSALAVTNAAPSTNLRSTLINANANSEKNNEDEVLFQVMKAVEAAEAAVKQQAQENIRLKTELQKKIQELEKYNSDKSPAQPRTTNQWDDRAERLHNNHTLDEGDGSRSTNRSPQNDPSDMIRQVPIQNSEDYAMQSSERQSEFIRMNGAVEGISDGRRPIDAAPYSNFPQSSTTSFSPSSHHKEGELELRNHLSEHGLMPMAEFSNSSLWKQTREHEEEISQLQRHLADFSVKEAQLQHENYMLEKRIAYMRMAFDQQQQELVDAASKALSYRQDIIEENIRLTYALQAAQQDRSMFVSYLMPLLAEYSLQPSVSDAQSIVSNLKVLFKHLQVKLIMTEGKLKESQYQLAPWLSDGNSSSFPPQSPSYPHGALASQNNGLELVARPEYSHGNVPNTSSGPQTPSDWDLLDNRQGVVDDGAEKNLEGDEIANYSPFASRNIAPQGVPEERTVMHNDSQPAHYSEEPASKQVTFSDTVTSAELDYLEYDGRQKDRENAANWSSKSSPYSTTMDDPTSYSPYLPPVLEEPSSSFSEFGDDDPLPAIEGLQISGDAFPGRELEASGYSINGTTRCNFEWVRHLEDGSVNYIDGAKQPNYLITADDVDTYLAIEVQPLDNRKRKGELVKVFANEHRKITCDPEMQKCIEKALYTSQSSYRVSMRTVYLDIWEPATLVVKREGYSIKPRGANGESISEKFSSNTSVTILLGESSQFTITNSNGVDRILRAEDPMDISCSRDTIVLVLRLFIVRAGEKRKVKKKGLFF